VGIFERTYLHMRGPSKYFIQFKITLVRLHDRIILERVTAAQKKRSQSANLRRSNLNCPASDKLEVFIHRGGRCYI
jgi:hypothetical protein